MSNRRMIRIVLPYPPSVNRMWRTVNGRMILSAEGRKYRLSCRGRVLDSIGTDRARVTIHAWMPDARRRDIDNLLKAALDVLTHSGLWQDDEQIDDLHIIRAGIDRVAPRIEVFVDAC